MNNLNIRWLVSLLLITGFMIGTQAQTTYLTESFEGSFPPTGWTLLNNGGNPWTQNTSSTSASDGSKSMKYRYHSTQAADAWAFTPAVNLTAGQAVEILFDTRRSSTSYVEKLKVSVGTAATVAGQSTELWDGSVENTTFSTRSLTYTAPAAGAYYFSWNCHSAYDQAFLYIDKVIIREGPDCPHVTGLASSDITASSVKLTWNSLAGNAYKYVVVERGAEPTTGTATAITDTSVVVNGLTDSHDYDAYVRSTCNTSDQGYWQGPVSFSTLCNSTVNFNETVDGVTVPNLPNCWEKITAGSTYSYYVKTEASSGNSYFKIYGKTSGDNKAILISPEISNLKANAGSKWLRLKVKNNSSILKMGVMSSNSASNTFTAIRTIPASGTYSFVNHDIMLTAEEIALIEDEDKYFAFMVNTYSGSIYLDDIVWEDQPTCMYPTALDIESVSDVSASIKWTTGGADHWDIEVLPSDSTPKGIPTFTNVSANPFTATGLNPNTSYKFYVRDHCSTTDLSEWAGPSANFTTECSDITAALTEDFNSVETPALPTCWTAVKEGTSSSYVYVKSVADGGFENSKAIRFHNSSVTSNLKLMLVTPPLSHLSDGTYQLRVLIKSEAPISIGSLLHPDSLNSYVEDTAFTIHDSYIERTIDFNDAPSTHRYIAIKHLASANYQDIYVDNFIWEEKPSCPLPSQLSVHENAEATQVTVKWNGTSTAASYELELVAEGNTATGTPTITAVNDTFRLITGLTSQSNYKLYLRSRCSTSETSPWASPLVFRTACASFDDLTTETFEEVSTPDLPECWSKIVEGPAGSSIAVATFGYSSKSVKLYNDNYTASSIKVALISPALNNLQAGTHQLRFKIKNDGVALGIGVMSDLEDFSSYLALDTIPANTNSNVRDTAITFNTASITAEHKYIVFKHLLTAANKTIYLDDISWLPATTCPWATGMDVTDIKVTSAQINWNTQASATYDIEVVKASQEFTGTPTYAAISDTFKVVTGLEADSLYKYQIKVHCSASSESNWEAAATTFRTEKYGNNCEEPITVNFPANFVNNAYTDSNQTTSGRGNNISNTFLSTYDEGYDIFYQLNLSTAGVFTITLDPKTTSYTALALFSGCPSEGNSSNPGNGIKKVTGYSYDDKVIEDQYLEAGTYFIMIDKYNSYNSYISSFNLEIKEITCPKPSNISASNILAESAELSWEHPQTNNWDLKYALASASEPNAVSIENITSLPYTLSGLSAETAYKVWVRSDCGASNTDTSDWVGPFTLTTYASCPTPSDVAVQPLLNTATVSWNGYFATHWDIEYGADGFAPTGTPTVNDHNADSYSITGLSPNTDYDLYVRADCGQNNTDTSDWVGPISFTTLNAVGDACNLPIVINYPADFSAGNYLAENQTTADRGNNVTSSCLYSYDDGNDIFYQLNITEAGIFDININPGPTSKTGILLTSNCDSLNNCIAKSTEYNSDPHGIAEQYLPVGSYIIMVDKSTASSSSAHIPSFTLNIVSISCPNPINFSFSDTTTQGVTADWISFNALNYDMEIVDHGATASGTATIAGFNDKPKVISSLASAHYYDLYLRSLCAADSSEWVGPFAFKTIPACDTVTGLTASVVGSTTATLNWDAISGANYQIAIHKGSFDPDTLASYITATDSVKELSGLDMGETYKVYVRSTCSTDGLGLWSESYSFTTDCGIFTEIDEDFTETYAPSCWSQAKGFLQETVTLTGTSSYWMKDGFANNGSTGAAKLNIYNTSASNIRKDWLITPSIDLGTEGNKQLEFDLALTDYGSTNLAEQNGSDDKFAVVISTDNGATWSSNNTLRLWDNAGSTYVYNSIATAGEHITITLPTYTGTVKIAFYGESTVDNADNDLFIDNVRVRDIPTCLEPTNLSTSNLTDVTATITWAETESATWDVKLMEVVDGATEPVNPTNDNISTNPYTITGLEANKTYKVWLRKDCDASNNNTNVSEWTDAVQFTTLASCPSPDNIEVSIVNTTANVSWNGYFATHWDIEYGADGFTPTGTPTVDNHNANSYAITGLTPSTAYDLYLRADCGQDNIDTSLWVGPISFTTGCNIVTELNETFSGTTFAPDCWTEAEGLLEETVTLTGTSSYWTKDGFANNGTTGAARLNISGTSKKDWLISPSIDLGTSGDKQLEFDLALTQSYYSSTAYQTGVDDKFAVIISTDNGATWSSNNTLRLWDNASSSYIYNDIATAGQHVTIYLTSYTGPVRIAFYGESTVSNASNDLFIDTVKITTAPSCLAPSNLTASNISGTSADLNWTNNGSETQWLVEYGAPGFELGSGTSVTVSTAANTNLSGLTPNTDYQAYVKAVCSSTESSDWSDPVAFSTPCASVTELNEDFSGTTFAPDCWSIKKGLLQETVTLTNSSSSSATSWKKDGFANNGSAGAAKINIYGTSSKNWLITPPIDLGTGTVKQLEFDLALTDFSHTTLADLNGSDDKFAVVISTDNGATWSSNNTLRLWDNAGSSYVYNDIATAGEHITIYLTAYSGSVKIAFYGESTATNADNDLFIDNVQISDAPSCLMPNLLKVIDTTATTSQVTWAAGASETEWTVEYGTSGFAHGDGTTVTATNDTTEITGLTPNTEYDVYVKAVCSSSESSDWLGPKHLRSLNNAADFLSFTHSAQFEAATINTTDNTISLTVGYGTDPAFLVPSFTLSEHAVNAKIGDEVQVSGTSMNDFTTPVVYTITAEDGTTENWTVTVTVAAPNDATDIVSFSFDEQTGAATIDATNHTVAIEVNWETELTSLQADFTLSYGASAKIGVINQVSGTTNNDFTNPVVYTITAENGTSTQDWTVTVTHQDVPQGALCSNPIPLTLPASDITGTTEGFGDDYDDSVMGCTTNYLDGDDIIYEFTIPEDGTISGSATYTNTYGGMIILDGCPDQASTQCVVTSTASSGHSSSFNSQAISAGTYYLVISTYATPQNTEFAFNLTYAETLSDSANIVTYNIPGSVSNEVILADKKVKVVMPYGTDLSNLIADFTLSEGANATLAGTAQVSGTTANDWSSAAFLEYYVLAEDGATAKTWKVYVSTVPNTENDILTFTIPNQIGDTEIDNAEHKVTVTMPAGTNLANLVPSFTLSDEATAKVSGVIQESGVTAHSWESVNYIEYSVIAGNNDAQTWKVYVTNAQSNAAEITKFKLIPTIEAKPTEYDSDAATVKAFAIPSTNLAQIVPWKVEVSEGATATYNGNPIVESTTIFDFTTAATVVVTAEDGTVKNWTITVEIDDAIRLNTEENNFNIYPNPTKGLLHIESTLEASELIDIEIINTAGQVVKRISNIEASNTINLEEQANGLYLVKINTTKGIIVKKINILK